jgi:uncharacterized phage infection (PIP) family protein YhgE
MEVFLDSIDGETLQKAFEGKSPREKALIPEGLEDKVKELTDLLSKLTKAQQTTKEDKKMDQLFESKDQVKEFIIACIDEYVTEKAKTEQTQKAREAAAEEKKNMQETLTQVAETMKSLKEDVDALKGKTPERKADETADETPPAETKKENDGEENVFKGLFFKTDALAAAVQQ